MGGLEAEVGARHNKRAENEQLTRQDDQEGESDQHDQVRQAPNDRPP